MSYTMTLDLPKSAAAYVERRGSRYRAELNAIFVAIVTANMQSDAEVSQHKYDEAKATMDKLDELVAVTSARRTEPYVFNRADAYEETLV